MTPRIGTSIGYLNIQSKCRWKNHLVPPEIILTNYRCSFDFFVSCPVSSF